MKCSNCGREFEGNFCPRCGHPARQPQQREENMPAQAAPADAPAAQPYTAPTPAEPKPYIAPATVPETKRKTNRLAIAGFILALLVFLLTFMFNFMAGATDLVFFMYAGNVIINILQPLSLIFNTAGLCRSKVLKNGKGLAAAGLVINILYILYVIIIILIQYSSIYF